MIARAIGAGPGRLPFIGACALAMAVGCAGRTELSPPAGTQFDGTYAGQDSLVVGVEFQCGQRDHQEAITVSGGRFDYPFAVNPPRLTPLPVQVAADGTFRGQMQYGLDDFAPRSRFRTDWATVSGRIAGGLLDATVTTERCVRRFVAQHG